MRIVKEQYNLRCDVVPCRNMADYQIEVDDSKRHNIHICRACLEELTRIASKEFTPKSVENIVKRAEDRRVEWNGKINKKHGR